MKIFKLLYLTLVLACIQLNVFAQGIDTTAFEPNDREKLYKEIEEVLLKFKRPDCEETMKSFKKAIKERRITEQHYEGFLALTNIMVKRKMKRFNYIRPLLETIIRFAEDDGLSSQYFDKWIDISSRLLKDQDINKPHQFQNYLKWSYEFWINGNLYKVALGSHTWKAESKQFIIKYEDKELSVEYPSTTLWCFSSNERDSLTISKAKGTYYPLREQGIWKGESGVVYWNQDGAKDARCDIKEFSINAKETRYEVKDAILTYPSVFKEPLEGLFEDRISRRSENYKYKDEATGKMTEGVRTPRNLSYPRFASKSRNIRIDDIGEGVDYEGGFRIEGSVVRGFGDEYGRSRIYITNNKDQVVCRAEAKAFDIFKGQRVVSYDAEVSLYLYGEDGKVDSIYHPNSRISFDIKKRFIELTRGDSKASKVPFFNSLQQSEMRTSYIKWPIDEDKIQVGDNNENMEITSDEFFDDDVYEKYSLITTINPLIKFALYSEKLESSTKMMETNSCNPDGSDYDGEYAEIEDDLPVDKMCELYPEQCPQWFLDAKADGTWEKMQATQDSLEAALAEEANGGEPLPEAVPFDPRRIPIEELLVLLDPRMERLTILDCREIIEAKKKPYVKIIENYKDWKDFNKNYCHSCNIKGKYRFGAIEATNVIPFTHDVKGPSHDISNGWPLIQELISDGFATYDPKDKVVELRDKLFHYKQSMNRLDQDHDFDRIKIKSVPSRAQERESNAVLDIGKNEMETMGVQSFVLSDSQNVWAEPFGQKVRMKPNRDMDFDGTMTAGMLRFTGNDFHFSYDKFNVFMDSVDYVDFYIYERRQLTAAESPEYAGFYTSERETDELGNPSKRKVAINNQLRSTKGLVLIDISNNKSGKKESNPTLPSFDCTDTSHVYFERNNRMNKYGNRIYPHEEFYYEVDPFLLDSLDNFDPTKLRLSGRFYSADIFPMVVEPLKVMFLDLSFGFETETPGFDGYPIYLKEDPTKGKGLFTGLFGVSNQGLIGRGRLDYLGATIESDYIELLPERFITDKVDSFKLKEESHDGVEFPKVIGQSVFIDWAPYSDSMFIESDMEEGVPFQFFESGEFTLEGSLNLTPNGLLGRGVFEWDEAHMESNPGGDFVFGRNSIKSPSTTIKIRPKGESDFVFDNNNVEADVDFDERIGNFISNEKDLSTDLQANSYKTSLDRFKWLMDEKKLLIDATQGKAGFFLATEESQDSLFFLGESAELLIDSNLLKIDGVDFIRVADAFIYPKDRHVEIEEASHMRTLLDSRIVADTSNKNHQILRATINILSRREYTAEGFLEFNVDNFKDQEIEFTNIRVHNPEGNKFITRGSGEVIEQDSFFLDKRTRFKGNVELSAESKNLTFGGYAKLTSSVIPYPQWFGINSLIDKKNVAIDYDVPQNPEGQSLYVGLFLGMDSLYLYPCILAPKDAPTDRSVFSAKGMIKFNQKDQMYMFGDSARVVGDSETGKLFTVSEVNSKVTAEGSFDFSEGFNREGLPPVGVECIGDFSFFMDKESDFRFDMTTLIDYYVPEQLSAIIIEDLLSNEETQEEILYTSVRNKRLKYRMAEYVTDEKEYEKMWKKTADDNKLILPDVLKHTFFFSKMILKWSDKTQSFMSQGNLQLASIQGRHVGQILKGAMEVQMDPTRGDVLNLYFTSPNGDWYFFQYTNGILMTASSSPDYNNAVTNLKRKDSKVKVGDGTFEVVIGNSAMYSQFRQRANSAF